MGGLGYGCGVQGSGFSRVGVQGLVLKGLAKKWPKPKNQSEKNWPE